MTLRLKSYLAYIVLFLITFQNIDREDEVPGKYIGRFLGEHNLIIKDNGKFVLSGYNLVPKYKGPIDPPPGNMPSPVFDRKKSKYKTKGTWVYFKRENLDGVILKTTNQIDSLYFLENRNLSPNNPNVKDYIRTVINEVDTLVVYQRNTIKMPDEFLKKDK